MEEEEIKFLADVLEASQEKPEVHQPREDMPQRGDGTHKVKY